MQKSENVFQGKQDEKILVVSRAHLFKAAVPHGVQKIDFASHQKLIKQHGQFLWRSEMEVDSSYKQIIPYLIFKHEDRYFLMRRKGTASEVRLQSKYSLGIGGHIRENDLQQGDIINWAQREFEEEISYKGSYQVKPIGILNDESNAVGQVHSGFVFLLEGDSSDIAIRSELQEGRLASLDECRHVYGAMESWSKMVFDYLINSQIANN